MLFITPTYSEVCCLTVQLFLITCLWGHHTDSKFEIECVILKGPYKRPYSTEARHLIFLWIT